MLNLPIAPTIHFDGDTSNLDTLLARDDIKSVIIVLPITTQPSVILKAFKAGKHVLSEKPVAPDVATAKELITTYERDYKPKGIIWRVAENFEVEPVYKAAATLLKEGKIGKIQFFRTTTKIYVDENSKYYKTPWRTVPDVSIIPFNWLNNISHLWNL